MTCYMDHFDTVPLAWILSFLAVEWLPMSPSVSRDLAAEALLEPQNKHICGWTNAAGGLRNLPGLGANYNG